MCIFAVGQLGWSILSGIISAWLVTFYLPTESDISQGGALLYITPGLVIGGFLTVLGLITALSRIFDAVTDPLIASLSDRSKNKRGRRIPFMQYSAIPLALVTILLFCTPVQAISGWNVAWISIFIVLFYLFMTMYCTPYNALISEFGKTQEDRMFISTAISLTYFVGTLLAYTPFVFAGLMRGSVGFAWSYRICFIVLAVIAAVCMLIPTFLLKEKDFVDATPSQANMFKSLASMNISESYTMIFLGVMTVLSAAFYPIVSKLVKKFGKKKLTIAGFLGLALAYVIATLIGVLGTSENPGLLGIGVIPGIVFGVIICVIAAFPMALLGIIPQSIVADVAEADGIESGENREGMFFAARTFAMKFGQSLAMLLFTSLAIIGTAQNTNSNDITASTLGMTIVGLVAVAFCVLGAVILVFYNEKKIMKTIDKNTLLIDEDSKKMFMIENKITPVIEDNNVVENDDYKKANTACFELAEEDIMKENKNEKTHITESEKSESSDKNEDVHNNSVK